MKRVPTLIYCADGNPSFASAAVELGWKYGARLPSKVYQEVYFADQDWKDPDRKAYMKSLSIHRPEIATILDWEREEQRKEVMSWAEEASQYVNQIVIIPKLHGVIKHIPDNLGKASIILGYSVPTSYGGTKVTLSEFGKRPVHLLGGSPHKQMSLSGYLNVMSCDGNMVHQQAHKCRFWSRKKRKKGHWVQLSQVNDSRGKGDNLRAFKLSLQEIKDAWEGKGNKWG